MARIPRKPAGSSGDADDDFTPPVSPETLRLRSMLKLSETFDTWKPASQVLTAVRSVKTIFPQFNRASRVGGYPLERWAIVHGPSSHGKTTYIHGIGLSFLQAGHFYALVDAEYTTPITWLRELMGDYAVHPGFVAMRPDSYEQTVDAVEHFLKRLAQAREGGEMDSSTSAFVAVDSLKKLMPLDIWAKLTKFDASDDKGSVDGMSGRMPQMQAAMNTAWMNRLTPLLSRTGTAMLGVARESENIGRDPWEPEYKVQGGKAINYDSSLSMRVLLAGYVKDGDTIVGERHRLILNKTKIGRKEDKGAVCYFHMSNGALIPAGFDRARDVLELAKEYGIVAKRGNWLTWRACRWQGDNAAVKKLTLGDPEALRLLQGEVEARFSPDEALPQPTMEDQIEARA